MYKTGVAYTEQILIQVKLKKGLKFPIRLNTRSQVLLLLNLTNCFISVCLVLNRVCLPILKPEEFSTSFNMITFGNASTQQKQDDELRAGYSLH